jgi:hypothetical protein
MSGWEDLAPVERVAEGLWQTVRGIDGGGVASHKAWLALPETEKVQWRTNAGEAIENWKKSHGY